MSTDDSHEQVKSVKDIFGQEIHPGSLVVISINNKHKLGIINTINWKDISIMGKAQSYPILNLLIAQTKYDLNKKKTSGCLRAMKTTTLDNVIMLPKDYVEKLSNNASNEIQKDIAELINFEINGTELVF